MKKTYLLILTVLLANTIFASCNKDGSEAAAERAVFSKDASYVIGMNIGLQWADNLEAEGIAPNYNELIKGFKDAITGKNTRFDQFEASEILEAAFDAMYEEKNASAIESEIAFLAENSRNPGIMITPSGLQYEVVTEGTGDKPTIDDTVRVNYSGTLVDGTEFDSSYGRGEPTEFPISMVIPGWTEGLQLMSVGSNYIFYIPSELGYGTGIPDRAGGYIIPPYATLIFDVELVDIVRE